ncbi:MAG: hypothetical protein II146_06945, partial [Treponema sp.]|nr:hypothetical protein [Treponema sp.]
MKDRFDIKEFVDWNKVPGQYSVSFIKNSLAVKIAENEEKVFVACSENVREEVLETLRTFHSPKAFSELRTGAEDWGEFIGGCLENTGQLLSSGEKSGFDLDEISSESPAVNIINAICLSAVRQRASDIHIESMGNGIKVRFRIDGVMRTVKTFSMSVSKTQGMYLDLNGDGLADFVYYDEKEKSVKVKYNSGNCFTEEKKVELPTWSNVDKYVTKSDVDGDLGFVGDIKIVGNAIQNFIRDYSFANKYRDVLNDADNALSLSTDFTVASNANLGGNFKVSIPIPTTSCFININGNGSGGAGVTATENALEVSMTDLDGDGMADQVMRVPGKATFWKKNIAGKAGLLNCVHLPTGGSYTIEYKGMYGTA